MPRLAICSRDLHWQWINWAPLYDTIEVSMLRLTWLTVAQHVFQPALTGRLELISRKIVSCEPGTKAIAVSRFRAKLSPANWVQGVTSISRQISRSWAPKNGVQHATAIYPIPRYTRPRYIGLTLYCVFLFMPRNIRMTCPSTALENSQESMILRALLSDGILHNIFSCRFISKWTFMLKIANVLSIIHEKV